MTAETVFVCGAVFASGAWIYVGWRYGAPERYERRRFRAAIAAVRRESAREVLRKQAACPHARVEAWHFGGGRCRDCGAIE